MNSLCMQLKLSISHSLAAPFSLFLLSLHIMNTGFSVFQNLDHLRIKTILHQHYVVSIPGLRRIFKLAVR